MKNRIIKLCLLACVLVICTGTADAQAKRSAKKRTSAKKSTSKNANNAKATIAKDTVKRRGRPLGSKNKLKADVA